MKFLGPLILMLLITYTNLNAQTYCTPSTNGPDDTQVNNVTLGNLNNDTPFFLFKLNGSQGTATGLQGVYANFTASTVPVPIIQRGAYATITVTIGYGNVNFTYNTQKECKVFFDFNHNGILNDPGEEFTVFALAPPNSITTVASLTFAIPVNANVGNTRMRVIADNAAITTPCGPLASGEAEDYLVNIVSPTVLYVDANATGANTGLSWTDAFTNLQSALDFPDVPEIRVSKGTYRPSKNYVGALVNDASACYKMKNNLSILGGFSTADSATILATRDYTLYPTILSGDVQQDGIASNNAWNVINNYNTGLNNTAVLDGFIVTKAWNNLNGLGGGVINSATSPTFKNCNFLDNFAGNVSSAGGAGMYNVNGANPTLDHCTFSTNITTGFNTATGAGLFCDNASATINRCSFLNNICNGPDALGGGIYINTGNDMHISNSLFKGNNSSAIFSYQNNMVLTNVTITNNTPNAFTIAGGFCNLFGNATFNNSIIYNNIGGAFKFYSGLPTVAYSDIEGSGGSANWNSAYGINSGGNIDNEPLLLYTSKLNPCSPAINSGSTSLSLSANDLDGQNRIVGSSVDMGCFEFNGIPPVDTILYVDANATGSKSGLSWANAYTNLQDALDLAKCTNVKQIWVSKGTYVPSKNPSGFISNNQYSCFQMLNNVSILGGFSVADGAINLATRNYTLHPTILSGDIQQDGIDGNNVYNVINNYQSGVNNTAVLDGFTITKAYNNFNGIGGGIINANTSPTFLNCRIQDNFAGGSSTARGAGMHNQNGANPIIKHCAFSNNSTSGINNAFGSGLSNDNSAPFISRCKFIGNICSAPNAAGGGMYTNGGSPIQINNSLFSGNNAAAILSDGNNMVLNQVTIAGNTPSITSVAGGLCFISCNPSIYNSVIYTNTGGSVFVYSGIPTFAYSDVQGSGAPSSWNTNYGVNYGANLDVYPNWNTNFKPYNCSPLINAGTAAFGIESLDIDGNARLMDINTDMGCYELNPAPSQVFVTICEGSNYLIPQIPGAGGSFSQAGVYNLILNGAGAGGCDSLMTLNLSLKPISTSTTSVQTCFSYLWNGTTYTNSGLKYFTTTGANGCDSVATLNLTIIAQPLPGAALGFDGLDDYVETPHNSNFNCAEFTIETWIKWHGASWGSDADYICSKGENLMELRVEAGNRILFLPAPGVVLYSDFEIIQPGTWFHLAAVYNPSSGVAKLYINGIEKPFAYTIGSLTTPIPTNGTNLFLGQSAAPIIYYGFLNFHGQMDEFRFWNRALSQAEIQSHMNCEMATTACSANGLIQNLHFNQGIALGNNTAISTITDASGFNNHGTMNNFTRTQCISNSNFISPGGVISDVSCSGIVIFVDASATGTNTGLSWADAFTDLQSALDYNCSPVAEIWVSKGTYTPSKDTSGVLTNNRSSCFKMKNHLSIIGGFSTSDGATTLATRNYTLYPTILSGDIQQDGIAGNNTFHVINNLGLDSTAILDGFTITKATNNTSGIGGGLINSNASPTILNCTFFDNFAGGTVTARGAGMHNQNGSEPRVEHCTFSYNYTSGITNAYGSGMSNDNSTPFISRCKFIGNICAAPNAVGGGIYSNGGNAIHVNNSLLNDNNAAAIVADGNNIVLNHVTITGNTQSTTSVAGGLCFLSCNPTINNSIIYNNPGGSVYIYSGIPTFAYSDIEGSGAPSSWNPYYGVNYGANKDVVPNWNSTFKPYPCSPTVNAGTTAFGISPNDLDGNPRIVGINPDMGCYEAGEPNHGIINASICDGTNYIFPLIPGAYYNLPGTYNLNIPSAAQGGCDSLVVLNLTVKPTSTSSSTITSCGNYTWNGIVYTTSGIKTYTATNAVGCDSTAYLDLNINPTSTSNLSIETCSSYVWNGNTYTTSGMYTYVSFNSIGCDSIATLDLHILTPQNQSFTALEDSICNGNQVTIHVSNTETNVDYTLINMNDNTPLSNAQMGSGSSMLLSSNTMSSNVNLGIRAKQIPHDGIHFDGINDYLSGSFFPINSENGTWSSWISKDDWTAFNDDRLFSNGVNYTDNNSFYISLHPGVGFHFRYGGINNPGNGIATYDKSHFSSFAPKSWHHLAATWNTVAGTTTLVLFVDGVQVSLGSATCAVNFPPPFYLSSFGSGGSGTPYFGPGRMENIQLWSVAKSAQELRSMSTYTPSPQPNLIGFWTLNGITTTGNQIISNSAGSSQLVLLNYDCSTCWSPSVQTCPTTFTQSIPITVSPCNQVNLKLFLQGYYTGSDSMTTTLLNEGVSSNGSITDSVIVELHDVQSPYSMVTSCVGILQTNGMVEANFIGSYSGNYYVAVRHRNHLETWTSIPLTLISNSIYDFTTSSSKAYGDNQSEVESGVWALYSGDINQDENIDLIDASLLEADINNFEFGYFVTDINGDGNVDLIDSPNVEDNINNFVFSVHP